MSDPDCIFCKIIGGEIPATVIDQDERTIAFMDINPATRGHALVATRQHVRDLLDIGPEDLAATITAAQRLARRMTERLGADGINVLNNAGAASWQEVFHYHLHVIPRYHDDPLRLPWRPAPGDPDQIAAAAEALR
jgi:histidine triad (HIT) family protein